MTDRRIVLTESKPGRRWLRAWPAPVAALAAGACGYFLNATFGILVAALSYPAAYAFGMVARWRVNERRTVDVVLALLMDGPDFGKSLAERVADITTGKLRPDGGIYPILRGLERLKLLRSFERMGGPERAGIPRVYYALTPQGRAAVEDRGLLAGPDLTGTTPPAE